jgi:hypothetical protein
LKLIVQSETTESAIDVYIWPDAMKEKTTGR